MKDTFSSGIEVAANISIILVALLGSVVLIRNLLPQSPADPAANENTQAAAPVIAPMRASRSAPAAGTKVSLPGLAWGPNEESLLLVLSTRCHFCSESAPFYQRLAKAASERGKVGLIAVFPQGVNEARKYLQQLNIPLGRIIQIPLNSIGIRGTSTLMLVDKMGLVKNTWVGRLPPEKEAEVLRFLKP